jgi:hypothetical protein
MKLPHSETRHWWKILREPHGNGFRSFARMTCAKCDAFGDVTLTRNMPPEFILKKFQSTGWNQVNKTQWLCHACKPKKESVAPMKATQASPITQPSMVAARPLSLAETRKVMALLEEKFDPDKGSYVSGYSDQRIAETIGVPRARVTEAREEAFGKIKIPPELVDLRQEMDLLTQEIYKLSDKGDKLALRLAAVEAKNGVSA